MPFIVLLSAILVAYGAEPEATVATTVAFTEGPAQGPDGLVYFTDVANNRILRFDPRSRKHEVFRADSNGSNGLLFDGEGRLIACERSRLTRTDMKTGKVEVIAASFEGKQFNGPNDVTIDSKGRLYFTDPASGAKGIPAVYRLDPDGKIAPILTGPDTEWPTGS